MESISKPSIFNRRNFLKGGISLTLFSAFLIAGWVVCICMSFAAESSRPGDILWEHSTSVSAAVMGISFLSGVGAAWWVLRTKRISRPVWVAFSLALGWIAFLVIRFVVTPWIDGLRF